MLRARLDAVYRALSATTPSGRSPAEEPLPALSLTLSCPKLALVLERALVPDPATDSTLNPPPDTAAPHEALELAVLGVLASIRVPNGCGTVSRQSSSRGTGAPAASVGSCDRQGDSSLESFCWKAIASSLQMSVSKSMPEEAKPFVLLASPAAGVPVSPAGAALPIPSERFLSLEWGSATAGVSAGGDGFATGAEPEALRVCVAPINARLTPAIAMRLARLGPPLGFLADSLAELAREAGAAPARAAVAAASSRGGRRRLLTDAPATLRHVKVWLTRGLLHTRCPQVRVPA